MHATYKRRCFSLLLMQSHWFQRASIPSAFAELLRNETKCFVLYVCPSARVRATQIEKSFVKCHIYDFHKKKFRQFPVLVKISLLVPPLWKSIVNPLLRYE